VLGRPKLDKREFSRKKVLGFGLLVPLKETQMARSPPPRPVVPLRRGQIRETEKEGISFFEL